MALGLRLSDEVSGDLRPPLRAFKAYIETLVANWDLLDPSQRDELLVSALKRADELELTIQALEARLEAADMQWLDPEWRPSPLPTGSEG
jgi:K+-sensing histidine kinase KdpD